MRPSCRLAPLVLMTDPERLPDPVAAAKQMPKGAAIIYRHFGKPDAFEEAEKLRQVTFDRHQQLLIGTDPKLATKVGADGVHFPRDAALEAPTLWRQLCPDWIISMAGLKTGDYTGDLNVLNALLVSSIFKSHSPSAGTPIGLEGLKARADALSDYKPGIFALGGINADTAKQLINSGAAGIAGVSGIIPRNDNMTNVTISKQESGDAIQFRANVDGMSETGVLDLERSGDGVYTATHTGVPRAMGGKGVGSALVKALMEDARANGYKIIPACSFVAAKFKRHKEWQDLRA